MCPTVLTAPSAKSEIIEVFVPVFFVDILGQKQPIYNDDDQLIINIMIVNYDLKSCFVKSAMMDIEKKKQTE